MQKLLLGAALLSLLSGTALPQTFPTTFDQNFKTSVINQFKCNQRDISYCYFECFGAGVGRLEYGSVDTLLLGQGAVTLGSTEVPETQYIARFLVSPGPPPLYLNATGYVEGPNASCQVRGMDVLPTQK